MAPLYKVAMPAMLVASANIPERRPRSLKIKTTVKAKMAKRAIAIVQARIGRMASCMLQL